MAAIAATAVAFPLLRSRRSRLAGAAAGVLVMAARGRPLSALVQLELACAPPATKPAASPQVLAMVAKLEQHMQDAPDDLTGWLLLGRSDLALERIDDAVAAYEHAHRLDANNVEALLGLGEALSMRAGGNITPAAGRAVRARGERWSRTIRRRCSTRASAPPRAAIAPRRGSAGQALKGMHPPPRNRCHAGSADRRARHRRSGGAGGAVPGGERAAGEPAGGGHRPARHEHVAPAGLIRRRKRPSISASHRR